MAPRRHIASTTGVNPPLICLLCEMELPYTGNSGIANTGERDQILKQQWKIIWRAYHVMVPSREVEKSDFPSLSETLAQEHNVEVI